MVVKLFEKETCEKIGDVLGGYGTFGIPDEYFEGYHQVISKDNRMIIIQPKKRLMNALRLHGISKNKGYAVPFAFISCVEEW